YTVPNSDNILAFVKYTVPNNDNILAFIRYTVSNNAPAFVKHTVSKGLEYYDPDIDYEILDDNASYLENISEIPFTPKTTTDESVTTDYECASRDFAFDERALNHAKNFVISTIEHLEQDESDINWLTPNDNLQSEVESMWTLPTDDINAIDYEIVGDSDINNQEKKKEQCVIIDYEEGRFQRCLRNTHRPIKQLMGIWELDFQTLDIAIKVGTNNALNNLGSSTSQKRSKFVCSRCFDNEGGHFFQRRKKGIVQFSCAAKHTDDNQFSLQLLGRWIQEMAIDKDQQLKAMLLEEI
ncbi:26838_t:CDS:2, partial [Racocetra persica]